MPREARPFDSLRSGAFDEPPASEMSTPQTRRSRLRRAIQDTQDLAREQPSADIPLPIPTSGARRSIYVAPSTRRRQRSPSPREDESRSTQRAAHADNSSTRRHKRRRLGTLPPAQPKRAIKYGYYGQVEPGRLKLDLISCDGGEHRDPKHPATSLGPENLLRHDKSVYCSERPYANVVLRHGDEGTPFCLEKLWVVGPEHGFTAPVREGVVYVAMTLPNLQPYIDPPSHARRSTFHRPPPNRELREPRDARIMSRSLRSSPERLSLAEALRDPEVNAASEEARPPPPDLLNSSDEASYYGHDFGFGRTDPEAHCEIPSSTDIAVALSGMSEDDNERPVTLLSDEEPGPEDSSSQDVLDYRLQRLRLVRRRFEENNWDRDERWAGLNRLPPDPELDAGGGETNISRMSRLHALMARSRVRDDSASVSPERFNRPEDEHSIPAPRMNTQYHERIGDLPATPEDKNVTTARFYIKRHRSKVAIKFDPPVSGRFILLKLWAEKGGVMRNGGNVDVQSVIAMGYGGGRFFPAVCVRY